MIEKQLWQWRSVHISCLRHLFFKDHYSMRQHGNGPEDYGDGHPNPSANETRPHLGLFLHIRS
jgi:hypothetical protein